MLKVAKLLTRHGGFVAIWLVIISCDYGSAFRHPEDNHKEKRSTQKRICPISHSVDGYQALERLACDVQFLRIDENYTARVRWKPPAAKRVPVDGFLIQWTKSSFNPRLACDVVNNETTSYDIKPSPPIWKHDDVLKILILPLPFEPAENMNMLTFTPRYYTEVRSTTTPALKTTKKTTNISIITTKFDTNNNRTRGSDENRDQDEYGVKLILGSVVGVAMAIVLIIILAKSYTTKNPPSHKDTYYISRYAESNRFVKELKEFVNWLRDNQFDVQMLTDEGDLLTMENKKLWRESPSFTFCEHMLKTTDKVFIILSPSYLKLCQINEDDAINQNVSEEDKRVNAEIMQIRGELYDTMYRSNRFIPILFRLEETTGIPYWIKELVFFSWPEDKPNKRLLNWLNGLPECPPTNLV